MIRAIHQPSLRQIKLTGLPKTMDNLKNDIKELDIHISYTDDDNPALPKAILLDNVIIPAIVEALNRRRVKLSVED